MRLIAGDYTADVDVLGARILASSDGHGRLIGTLVYNENDAEDVPTAEPELLRMGIPILGVCYGMQLITHLEGGVVERGKREYGRAHVTIDEPAGIFEIEPFHPPAPLGLPLPNGVGPLTTRDAL